jgi:aldehyde:ferredoxin oxidoreductase
MSEQFGYVGKILRVDLSSRQTTDIPTANYTDRFLGGRGIALKVYWDEVPPEADAFSPENCLIFITGPLGGVTGIAGSVWQVCGKSPRLVPSAPEFFCNASLVGSWGANLKFAGYDGIVVHGRSDRPVYLLIQNGVAEIRDASVYWGKGAIEVREALKAELGRNVRVVTTGPAGDNQAVMASLLADDDASGSSGMGAVMGSKKLKAIVVRGTGRVVVADPQGLSDLRKRLVELRRDAISIYTGGYRTMTVARDNPKMKKFACYGCISGCDRAVYLADDGTTGKFFCQPPDFYATWSQRYYGKLDDTPFFATYICNQYGVDSQVIGMVAEWLRRCAKVGILNDESTGIPISRLGSLEFIETLVRKIALREGFGDILAQGIFQAARLVGTKSEQQIPSGIDQSGRYHVYGPKLYIITGLFYATEPRPPISQLHEISFLIHLWLDWCNKTDDAYLSTETLLAISKLFFGTEAAVDFSTYEGKGLPAKVIQDREYAKESLILCDMAWPITSVVHSEDHVGDPTLESKVFRLVTGRDIDEAGLYHIGDRIFNLQRAVLTREGHSGRQSDALVESDFTVPITFAPDNPECLVPGKGGEIISCKGRMVNREKFTKMLGEYYELRGWESGGLQTTQMLVGLGLGDIAESMAKRGLVV